MIYVVFQMKKTNGLSRLSKAFLSEETRIAFLLPHGNSVKLLQNSVNLLQL